MARSTSPEELNAVEAAVRSHPDGASLGQLAQALNGRIPVRTLQRHLKLLLDSGRLARSGAMRGSKYHIPKEALAAGTADSSTATAPLAPAIPLSAEGKAVLAYVRQPLAGRKPVGYDRAFLDAYQPNVTAYLGPDERAHLLQLGTAQSGAQPAGTYAKQILNRLLIDLSWNSSRLEGNTYSLLDTRRLIDFGKHAEGKGLRDAQMILNHKDAIEFLVGSAQEIGFNRYTVLNLHAMLANNLLADETAVGRLRRIAVGIEGSVYHPLEVSSMIEECFDQMLAAAGAIGDPFEQAFFMMVHLPYLQPFDDVNKRVSRLSANIPLIRRNLIPLAFTDVPRDLYTQAMLGVYESTRVELLKDVFLWAYERSAQRYAAARQSLGEPDPFRMRYRQALQDLVGEIVRACMPRKEAYAHIEAWSAKHVAQADQETFRDMTEREVLGLHEGNFARYRLRPSEFVAWQAVWNQPV